MAKAASTTWGQRLRWWLIILAPACATMLVGVVASWVLIGYLTERDALGIWQMTVRDAHGTVIGHGQAIVNAQSWAWSLKKRPPFVAYSVVLSSTVSMRWTAAGIQALGGHVVRLDHVTSINRMQSPERVDFFCIYDGNNTGYNFCSDFISGSGTVFTVVSGRDGPAFSLTLSR